MMRLAAAFCLLLINSAYLAAFASPTLFYFSNIVLHIALGIGLTIAALRRWPPRIRDVRIGTSAMWVLLAAAAASGAGLTIAGATTPFAWLLPGHIITAVAGSALLLVAILRYVARTGTPRMQTATRIAAGFIVL